MKRLVALALVLVGGLAPAQQEERPRLVLAITVDQLRGDVLPRMQARFGAGGFRRLLDGGVHYVDAQYEHAITETAVGHATLFTGAHPARHGIVGNDWLDPVTREYVYNTADPEQRQLDRPDDPRSGRSPKNLLVPTVGDQLAFAAGGRSKVLALSIKDRAAILPAGRAGHAYWLALDTGRFVTSTYYGAEPPGWRAAHTAADYSGAEWSLAADAASYVQPDERPFEPDVAAMGRSFPHALGEAGTPVFLPRFLSTPFADALLCDLACTVIEAEELGADAVTDLLCVSFSATDMIGHSYGPASREAEDNVLQLDRTLARLLDFVDERIGLARTLVVLSADHGVAESPQRAAELGFSARRIGPLELVSPELRARLTERFGVEADLVASYAHPYVYLDLAAIAEHGLERVEVERALAAELEALPGVAAAYSVSDARAGLYGADELALLVANNAHPARSGQVHVVADPYCLVVSRFSGLFASHGSPWRYDTHVPVLFAGWRLGARTVARRVGVQQVAPTLAALLGIEAPAASSGALLVEVLEAAGGR